ncbi:MAG TPA: CRISPR-associated endonuclease Cas2 [Candidatus Limnocylindrales bacterium]|nr:CRISPR-associated endonuclease Cas2 [Candidatus Limnocylindrales bacterium]
MRGRRHRLLVCYDIRDPKRLRQTHDVMLGYGDPLQYSVFVCELSATETALLESDLRRVIRPSVDSVAFVDLGPAGGLADRRVRFLGPARRPAFARYRIV